jgi:hypothetical protein
VAEDLFSTLLEVAGSGRGTKARIRRWSVVLLVMATGTGLFGAFMLLTTGPTKLSAAQIEDGRRPFVRHPWSSRRSNAYEITGHLSATDAVTTTACNGARRVFAPIISERPGSREKARLYLMASEADFERLRRERSFVGDLYWDLEGAARDQFSGRGLPVGEDVYHLESRNWSRVPLSRSAPGVLTVALVLALIALAGLLYATRGERAA